MALHRGHKTGPYSVELTVLGFDKGKQQREGSKAEASVEGEYMQLNQFRTSLDSGVSEAITSNS